ncbi:alcohol dehydrogenase [Burkholderia diffusa]|uniref:Alcohol dehydrogenase n=1 Tax=Burkholderia diffusa TaxID=488732 RepID=A0AAW3P923_9BURK|nr:aldo/keto reductase [Burkholderia diffusa]KWF32681.1 alcohol dehydrogenase [Burkholderia diffusa]KWF38606.1 alcohol dehydrogenase [Burkholderia diffusa]KWF46651.1 alcohol dehydrogenase [Burkholderia diffusa]KWF50775.1 alcohol dehydrogenase [Burkholderia diffusa]
MKYIKLGNTGLDVSKICLGMMSFGKPGSEHGLFPWAVDFEDAKPIFKKAIELGINYFDTANVYQLGTSEEVTGKLIKEFNLDRDDIVVATKVRMEMRPGKPNGSGLSRKAIFSEIDKSLKRLGLDYVDLYTIHRLDPLTPMEETMEALHDVVKSGKARYIGASTMYAWEFERLQNIAEKNGWTKFVAMQNHYNLIYREEEREMIPLCQDRKIALTPWSPLAGGRLAHPWGTVTARVKIDEVSKWVWDGTNHLDKVVIDNVQAMAQARGISMGKMSLAWLLNKPYITAPIVGATAIKHVEEAVAALDIQLSDDEIRMLENPYVAHPVLGMM